MQRRAMTVVEMLVALVLVSLLFGFLYRTFRVQRMAWFTVEKLDAIQAMRIAERRIRKELELGTAVLYPPPEMGGATTGHSFLIFTSPTNELRMIYCDKEGHLKMKEHKKKPVVLCSSVRSFAVRHSFRGQVWVEVTANAREKGAIGFAVSAHISNGFCTGKGPS